MWAAFHPLAPVIVVIAALFLVLAAVTFVPVGASKTMSGYVTKIRMGGGKMSEPTMFVQLPDRLAGIPTYGVVGCAVGDRITIQGQRHLLGWRFNTAISPCEHDDGDRDARLFATPGSGGQVDVFAPVAARR